MEYFDDKIDKVLKYLKVEKKKDINGNFFYRTSEGKLSQQYELRQRIREILGIDKQCSQCLDWKFDGDLSIIENSDKLICQKCAEEILVGGRQLID